MYQGNSPPLNNLLLIKSFRYIIGVYSKSKGTVQILDNNPAIFQLKQNVIDYDDTVEDEQGPVTGLAAKNALTQAFGSKKANKVLNQYPSL